jgi:hypothetical protein
VRDWLYSYCCGAGRGARAKYREASGRWRKRVFRRPGLILAVLAGATWLAWVLAGQSRWPLALGFLLGALLTGCIAILESPPAHIENWRTGAEGERRTARALAPLRRRGYVLLHDLSDRHTNEHDRRGNIDHVVVCGGGVFLLDSKYLGGEVSIDADNVHLQRRDDADDSYDLPGLGRTMRGRAIRLQEDIVAQTGVAFVQPVVVFWNPFEAGVVTGETVVFVHGERLGSWLEGQRAKMTPDVVALVADAIAAARPPARRGWRSQRPSLAITGRGTPVTGS